MPPSARFSRTTRRVVSASPRGSAARIWTAVDRIVVPGPGRADPASAVSSPVTMPAAPRALHTDVLLHAVMSKEAGLRSGRLISHCAMISVPTYARRIIVTDAALNIAPDTDQKRDICQNAIGFARALGVERPRVAVLAAVDPSAGGCRVSETNSHTSGPDDGLHKELAAAAPQEALIVLNAGSTSLKFGAYAIDEHGKLPLLCRGRIDSMHVAPHFVAQDADGKPLASHEWGEGHTIDQKAAVHFLIEWLGTDLAGTRVAAAGHRVVHGGARFTGPVHLDVEALAYLDSLSAIEPSHQPYNVRGVRAFAEAFPGRPQVACFDTSFHRTMPKVAQTYALPQDVRDAGVRHWGYHGISYEYISRQLPKYAPQAQRVVVGHLGGGASMCAMLDGRSVETTMGFGALSGLPMATRPGDVPLDALLYLQRSGRFDEAGLEKMLFGRSGLLGLSGFTGDMRVLQDSSDPRAKFAVEAFVYAMQKYTGAYAAVLGGLDAFVFTAGIGENSAPVRAALCERLGWLGVKLDASANVAGGPRISTLDSAVSVWVIPTDEERMIAQHTLTLLRPEIEPHSP